MDTNDIKRKGRAIIEHEYDAAKALVEHLSEDILGAVIGLIIERTDKRKGKVVTSGVGKAGNIAMLAAGMLSSTGTPSVFIHPTESQHGDLGVLQAEDILLNFSNSGKTREIIELCELATGLHPGIKTILITGHPESQLRDMSDYILDTGNPDEAGPLGLTPTTSTTMMKMIVDILVCLLTEEKGITAEDYYKRHYSGYLGQKARDKGQNKNS
jgi:arabinose-5-phosphate isomerase